MQNKNSLDELLLECEKEKLHLSGQIQPFGALIGVSLINQTILHVSANIESFLHVKPSKLLGTTLDKFNKTLSAKVLEFQKEREKTPFVYETFSLENSQMSIKIFTAQTETIIEFEFLDKEEHQMLSSLSNNANLKFLNIPKHETEIKNYAQILLEEIAEVIDYDRVMFYLFGEDWTGEVIAEVQKEGYGSYLGLRFPASDIPAIARQLYTINPFRHIPNTLAQNVDIFGLEENIPDLTYSDIRSVSPVHIEYMHNMGMNASFSVAIVVFGQLWGLVACHSSKAKYLSMSKRRLSKSLANAFTLGISTFLSNSKLQKIDSIERYLDNIFEQISLHEHIFDGIEVFQDEILSLIGADGFSIIIDNEILNIGDVPLQESLEKLDSWFSSRVKESSYSCDSNQSIKFNESINFGSIAGFYALKAKTKDKKSMRFYWFRNELKHEIAWAGNPDKPVIEKAGARVLSPRRSFEKWIEIKSGHSKPWSRFDLIFTMKFLKTVNKYI